jgi:hypothetical protein
MKVSLRRTGGFANLVVNVVVDSAKLVQDKANDLQQMVTKLLPFKQEKLDNAGMDLCHYNLHVVEDDGKEYDLEANDMSVTDDMQALFDFLMDENNQK